MPTDITVDTCNIKIYNYTLFMKLIITYSIIIFSNQISTNVQLSVELLLPYSHREQYLIWPPCVSTVHITGCLGNLHRYIVSIMPGYRMSNVMFTICHLRHLTFCVSHVTRNKNMSMQYSSQWKTCKSLAKKSDVC